jgi:hypothetical protein
MMLQPSGTFRSRLASSIEHALPLPLAGLEQCEAAREARCKGLFWDLARPGLTIATLSRREAGPVRGIAPAGWTAVAVVLSGSLRHEARGGGTLRPGDGALLLGPTGSRLSAGKATAALIVGIDDDRLARRPWLRLRPPRQGRDAIVPIAAGRPLQDLVHIARACLARSDLKLTAIEDAVASLVAAVPAEACVGGDGATLDPLQARPAFGRHSEALGSRAWGTTVMAARA